MFDPATAFDAEPADPDMALKLQGFKQLDGAIERFRAGLNDADLLRMHALISEARHSPLAHALPWWCDGHFMGHVPWAHADSLKRVLARCKSETSELHWSPLAASTEQRSRDLQAALQALQVEGQLRGWRGEKFSFWSHETVIPKPDMVDFVRIERAGFLYLGMLSHAVHINGFTPEGRLWCGQRSANKATDPGLWDNLTAGGLPAGETLHDCAQRELWEEAGCALDTPSALQNAGSVRISRTAPGGWHDEVLHVFNLSLTDDFVPQNQDGEVQAFAKLSARDVMERIADGQFTPDAALAIAQGLLKSSQMP